MEKIIFFNFFMFVCGVITAFMSEPEGYDNGYEYTPYGRYLIWFIIFIVGNCFFLNKK